MSGSGYGAGGWGSVPWGGADQLLDATECDLFLFDDCPGADPGCTPMLGILGSLSPAISVQAGSVPLQLPLDYLPGSNDLGMLSGDATDPMFPTANALITAVPAQPIDDVYTLEVTVRLEDLPNDFTDVTNRHVMFGVVDRTGPCAAIFLSKVGIAYAGAAHHNAGSLLLDSPLQQIPATASRTVVGETMTYRLAVSEYVGAVYLFATRTVDLPFTGHQLVAVLPIIDASTLSYSHATDHAYNSVRGSSAQPSRISLDEWCMSSLFLVPNIAPIASAGEDQAVRSCTVAMLDGSASFDPEGAAVNYQWRMIDAPITSSYVAEAFDAATFPSVPFDGFADKVYSATLSTVDGLDTILIDDVLIVAGVAKSIVLTGVDGNGFYVQLSSRDVPDTLVGSPVKLIRQRGISGDTTVNPTFLPDSPGLYKFDLIVWDGSLYSVPSVVLLNVLESPLPRACTPDAKFIFNHLSDFWSMVEDSDKFETFWSGIAQVASTELFTLWQHEYSKSIRDIQRIHNQRWMHYDLLLPEPVPELTSLRAIYSSAETDFQQHLGMPGTQLVLTSTALPEPLVLPIYLATTPATLAAELTNRFLELDTRFSVTVTPQRVGLISRVQIHAPFPFTIDPATTLPLLFNVGSTGLVSGTGTAVGTKSYLLDRPLLDLGLKENDLLVLDGIGYRIVGVVSGDPADVDVWDGQRLVLKDELPSPAPTQWSIPSLIKSELLDFYHGMVSRGDNVYVEVSTSDAALLVALEAQGACEGATGLLPVDIAPLGSATATTGVTVRLAKLVRRTHLPVSPLLVDLPNLQQHIVITSDEEVLRRNIDFFLEDYRGAKSIRFVGGVGGGPDVWEGAIPPERLWAEYSFIDNSPAIEGNFGIPAGLRLDQLRALSSSIDYLSAVRGLWYAYYNGPTPDNIRIGAQIFLGLPYAEAAGTITEIRPDFSPTRGRILVQDTEQQEVTRSYSYPATLLIEINPATGERYKVGDTVVVFAPLVEGVEIVDYLMDPRWFQALAAQRVMYEVQKYHRYTVRIDSRVFNLDAIILTRQFVLNIKPTYTYPLVLVSFKAATLDIDVRDSIRYSGTLQLQDNVCGRGGSTLFDDVRPAGAHATPPNQYWNRFDADDSDVTPDPTYPLSEVSAWAFDRDLLCPEDVLTAHLEFLLLVPTIVQYDTFLVFDQGAMTCTNFYFVGPVGVISATPAYFSPPVLGFPTVPQSGDIVQIRLNIDGGPGVDPIDYLVGIEVNAVEIVALSFDADTVSFEVTLATSVPVLAGDTVTLTIRPATGGNRNPPWTLVRASATVEGPAWAFDDVLPPGGYCVELPL